METEEHLLLISDIVYSGRSLPALQRNVLSSTSKSSKHQGGSLLAASLAYSSTLKMEIVHSFGMSVYIYQNTWRHIAKDHILHSHYHENLKSHKTIVFFFLWICMYVKTNFFRTFMPMYNNSGTYDWCGFK